MPSDNMKKILQQYQFNMDNMFANTKIPHATYDQNIPKMPTGKWVTSWNPNTADKNTKAALTSIKKNSWADAGQNFLHGLGSTLDIIDRPRNAIGNMLYAATDKKKDGLGGILNAGWKGLSGQQHKYVSDIAGNFGIKNKKGWNWNDPWDMLHDSASFLGDVVTDPLTYLTFGAGGVMKAATQRAAKPFMEKVIAEAAQKSIKKGSKEWVNLVDKHIINNDAAQHAIKTAQAKASKSAVNLDLPFGPKVSLASKAKVFRKETQKISQAAAESLASKIRSAGLNDSYRYDLLSHMLGRPIKSTKDLNTQEFDFVNKIWNDHLANSAGVHFDPKNLPDPLTQTAQYGLEANRALGKVKNDFTSLGKQYHHYDGLTGVSKATQKLFGKNTKLAKANAVLGKGLGSRRFTSIASKMADHRTQSGLNSILNASNKAYAYSHQAIQKLKDIAKTPEFKSLTPDDWKEVAYKIEGARPQHAGYVPPDPTKQAAIDHVATLLAGDKNNPATDYFMRHINDIESQAGLQRGNIADYFPHVYNIPQDASFSDLQAQLLNMGQRGQDILAGLKNAKGGFQHNRGEFKTMADLQDFLHANPGTPEAEKFANVSWNPLEAFGKRAISGMNQVAKKESVDHIIDMGLTVNGNRIPDGWKSIDPRTLPDKSPLEALAGQAVPPEIHKELTEVNKLLTSDIELNKFMEKTDKIMSILRRNYTVTKLGFHVRQSIGNVFQNTLAGVAPSAYAKAGRFLMNPDKYQEWSKELLENGIIHTGSSAADLVHNLGQDLNTGINRGNIASHLNPVGDNFALGKLGRKAGEYEDNMARTAHYMYMRSIGKSQEEAADSVRKYLYNYSEINKFGQGARRLIPFYQWMRNNLPFQLINTAKNPRVYQIAQAYLRNMQSAPDEESVMKDMGVNQEIDKDIIQQIIKDNGGVLPKYIQDNYIDIGGGNYYNVGLPVQDVKTAMSNPAEYFFGSLNPYMGLIGELRNNESNLNGAPIDKSLPTGEPIYNQWSGLRRILETGVGSPVQAAYGGYDMLTGADSTNLQRAFGVNRQHPDPAKEVGHLLQDKAKKLNTRAKYLKQQAGGEQ